MSRTLHLTPLASALVAAFLVVAAPLASAARAPGAFGVVMGVDGKVYAHAKVCVDRNGNARCDANELAVFSGPDGKFKLATSGVVTAEVGKDAFLVDAVAKTRVRVTRALVLRAPESGIAGPRSVGPLSTEMQAIADALGPDGTPLIAAEQQVRARLGWPDADVESTHIGTVDFLSGTDAAKRASLVAEQAAVMERIASAVADTGRKDDLAAALASRLDLERIANVVVIYAENRSFNNLFANFPGTLGAQATKDMKKRGVMFAPQKDRDGTLLAKLPPAWGGLTAPGQSPVVTQAQTTNVLPNAPFQVDSPTPAWGGPAVNNTIITRDLYHRYFENQMQIDGGLNDKFAAWGDSGALVMGYFDGSRTAMWKVARDYTLADRFFQGAFGGSYLNHQYLICACLPEYPNADTSPAHPSITVLRTDADGKFLPELALADNSPAPASALTGPPVFKKSGNLTPKDYLGDGTFHSVNTMQPAFQPSYNPPTPDDTAGLYATPLEPTTLPPQTLATIGDMLDTKRIAWTWYSGGWNAVLADRTKVYDGASGDFQAHHQPFNYYAALDPKTHAAERAAHLKDYTDLVADAAAGTLPPVAFYKPIGTNNEHPGYASLAEGDAHIADLVAKLQASPQWAHMLVVVTYDENGGQWDEVAPPKADLAGPGTRIPAMIISPFARRGFVDHTPYDTGSIARFITHRWSLPVLPGLQLRDSSLEAHGAPPMGDLTSALELRARP